MSEKKTHSHNLFKTIIVLIILVAVIAFVIQKPGTALSILIVMLGFGAVIMIHEFGHFIVAKLSGIKVEAFSIGFPPTLLAIQKIDGRIRISFLPKSPPEETNTDKTNDTENLTSKSLEKISHKNKADSWETEYRIGLIPFGGFVKMLGQVDTGAVEKTDGPRSFLNKPIIIRIAVVAAGVIFNAISAVLIFMILFLVGMELPPAVAGGVMPDSPADIAGIRPGDRFVEINGEILTLDHIEHDILRPRFKDPRVHFAINCAAKSCPALYREAFTGKQLHAQLDDAARRFINDGRFNRLEAKTLYVSRIFKWFNEDFNGDIAGFFEQYAAPGLKVPLAADRENIKVKYLDYDWSLNGE